MCPTNDTLSLCLVALAKDLLTPFRKHKFGSTSSAAAANTSLGKNQELVSEGTVESNVHSVHRKYFDSHDLVKPLVSSDLQRDLPRQGRLTILFLSESVRPSRAAAKSAKLEISKQYGSPLRSTSDTVEASFSATAATSLAPAGRSTKPKTCRKRPQPDDDDEYQDGDAATKALCASTSKFPFP